MLFRHILKNSKTDSALLLITFLFFWLVWSAVAMAIVYVIIVSITDPPVEFWSPSYSTTIFMELLVALIISFLNVRRMKADQLKRKGNIDGKKEEAPKGNRPVKINNPLLYFVRSFLFILGFFGLLDFGYLTYLSPDHKILPSVIAQSALVGSIIALLFSIIWFRQKLKQKRLRPQG